jgi:hypothetical protein
MQIPSRIPGLRLATLLLVAAGAIWIAPEGNLTLDLAFSTAVTLVLLAHLVERSVGGRRLAPWRWLLLLALLGFVAGAATAALALLLMAVKTGLHAHGPEYSAAELAWVAGSIPLWAVAGLLAGVGLALVTLAMNRR